MQPFVPEDAPRVLGHSPEDVQVGAADRRFDDLHHGISGDWMVGLARSSTGFLPGPRYTSAHDVSESPLLFKP